MSTQERETACKSTVLRSVSWSCQQPECNITDLHENTMISEWEMIMLPFRTSHFQSPEGSLRCVFWSTDSWSLQRREREIKRSRSRNRWQFLFYYDIMSQNRTKRNSTPSEESNYLQYSSYTVKYKLHATSVILCVSCSLDCDWHPN